MIVILIVLQAMMLLVVALGAVLGVGFSTAWLGAHYGSGWLVAGAILEMALVLLLPWYAGKQARLNGTSFRDAVTFRGKDTTGLLNGIWLALPVYALLIAALAAAGFAFWLGRDALHDLLPHTATSPRI